MIRTKSTAVSRLVTENNVDIQAIAQERKERSSSPTKEDYRLTTKLLRDFGIRAYIPTFKTMAELLMWRKTIIANNL